MKLSVLIPAYNTSDLVIKALDSIPIIPGLEIIIIDDGSTDDTFSRLSDYCWRNPSKPLTLYRNKQNMGVGYTRNRLLDMSRGEYILWLDSDDYLLPGTLYKFIPFLNGTDLVYYNLITAAGGMIRLNPDNREICCGTTKFIRRDFIGDTRYPDIKAEEDKYFFRELISKNPTECYTDILLTYYNWPRVGSLCYLKERGEL